MKLVWHAPGLWEADWLRGLLHPLIDEEIVDLDQQCFADDAIHVVSINHRPLVRYADYFAELRRRTSNITLFHASEEWYSGGWGLYRHFDRVVRNFDTWMARAPGILTLPFGYSTGTKAPDVITPASERPYVWSFAGEIKASRYAMARSLGPLEPAYVSDTTKPGAVKLDRPAYTALIGDTQFVPCPMGNVIADTWRIYEALELGAIPLAEKRLTLDYWGNLFGPNPIPRFQSWKDAARFAASFAGRPDALDAKQAELLGWWRDAKARTRSELHAFLQGPSHRDDLARFADLPRNRMPPLHEALRLAELLRHQSMESLGRRLSRPGGPIVRILREGFGKGARG